MTAATEVGVADLTLRPATLDDAAFVADLFTAADPEDPQDPVLLRYFWEHPADRATWERYVALRDGRPVGLAVQGHPSWEQMPERYGRINAELLPDLRTPERIDALLAFAEHRGREDGALRFSAWAWEWDRRRIAALERRGYHEERRERFWELDLAANGERLERMAEESRRRMRDQSIAILAIDRDGDPDKWRKLWRMSEEAEQDVPTTVPHVAVGFDTFMKWFRNPGLREDRIWIARSGDDVVGVSMLSYPPVRGVVQTDWTATARSIRGHGVARALKCETVMQAMALGVDRVRTDNDSRNAPILHINESMGYRIRGEMIQLLKERLAS